VALARARALGYALERPHPVVVVEQPDHRCDSDALLNAVRHAVSGSGPGLLLMPRRHRHRPRRVRPQRWRAVGTVPRGGTRRTGQAPMAVGRRWRLPPPRGLPPILPRSRARAASGRLGRRPGSRGHLRRPRRPPAAVGGGRHRRCRAVRPVLAGSPARL
ncbi:MAG: hypothetical protein H0X35_15550, partial [Pseudonocardiales bacterium]|nr:hypothetical protein [Pseudonocardiales bacterium]